MSKCGNRVYKCERGTMSTTPLGVSNRVDAPPIDIQEMIFILKIIEFFVPEKLLLLIFIKRALGNIAKQLNTQHYDKEKYS